MHGTRVRGGVGSGGNGTRGRMSVEWMVTVITALISTVGAVIAAYFSYRAERQKSVLRHNIDEWRILLDTAAANVQQLRDRVQYLEQQYDELSKVLNDERRSWVNERIALVAEYEGRLTELRRELEDVTRTLRQEVATYRERYTELFSEYTVLNARYQQLLIGYETLQKKLQQLKDENDALRGLLHKRRKTDIIIEDGAEGNGLPETSST